MTVGAVIDRELSRAVGRPRIGHEQLDAPIEPLRGHGLQHVAGAGCRR